jgi:hypothetical protein
MLTEPSAATEGDHLRPILKAVRAEPRIGCPAGGSRFERPNEGNVNRGAIHVWRALPYTTDVVEFCFRAPLVRAATSPSSSRGSLKRFDEAASAAIEIRCGPVGRRE